MTRAHVTRLSASADTDRNVRNVVTGPVGSYGLELEAEGDLEHTLAEAARWMLPADSGWPRWRISWSQWPATERGGGVDARGLSACRGEELGADTARLAASAAGGWIELDRKARRTTFSMPRLMTPAALVHPYLTSTAAIASHWFGRTPFHAGGFSVDGRSWGVLGGREMGKSSLLMGLHAAGVGIVSDDLMVLEAGCVYGGPRCLDLRRSAAEQFGAGKPLGRVGRRDRWRVDLPPVPGQLPLAGWIVLGWSDSVRIEPIPASQRLAALAMNRAITARGESFQGLLDAVAFPTLLFSRPRDWSKLDEGLEKLVAALAGC